MGDIIDFEEYKKKKTHIEHIFDSIKRLAKALSNKKQEEERKQHNERVIKSWRLK